MSPTPESPHEKRECEDKYSDNCDKRSPADLAFAIVFRHAFHFHFGD
jgi:hypothetical protein